MNGISVDHEGAVQRILLDRPEKLNAVDTPMLDELSARLAEAAADDSVRALLLTGAGRAFCSGGDLTGGDTHGAAHAANRVVQAITALPKPVVAGVHGAAAGFGCPLALACDLVVASPAAYFQLAFSRVGLMPDGGACALLPDLIGRARAARMAMTAERVDAATAFEWGMISHLAGADDYETVLEDVLRSAAGGPTLSYAWTKRALVAGTLGELRQVQAIEAEGQLALAHSSDFREGVRAFRERRSPDFRGR
ncbi:enoyl-CoA hydratase/isomerase family protein [Mycolicibacterium peregrinum]|uniref:enoyl-CoA hydratase-related protein n=1 Tax=Mycolicibacterium peregrinum TaxID=43304 RepID=UPI0006D7AA33|nr:enoyl-CoA hydratase-related protein [Mycolicibacterium peregrinum]MCV7205631.1 enoyl-CoA hydratase/isomerase family protein [Mycolicibacterium peregrinum]ORW62546.1 crotonase [Mycolicibacterium peregrinum]